MDSHCRLVRHHRGSRWLLGNLDVSQDVLDTSHAVGASVSASWHILCVWLACESVAVGGLPPLVSDGVSQDFGHTRPCACVVGAALYQWWSGNFSRTLEIRIERWHRPKKAE